MSATDEIGTVVVETRDGQPAVTRADPHILVTLAFLLQYEGAQGDTLVLPGGIVYRLGEHEDGRAARHARRVGDLVEAIEP